LKTSEIEGEILDRDSLQSSVCKEFGVGEKYLHGNVKPKEAGIAMLIKDLYTTFDSPLTHEFLYSWHDKLLQNKSNQITPWLCYFGKTIIEAQKQGN
jgi:hypothetical protein